MIASPFVQLIALALFVSPASGANFLDTPRCGDCWCIPEDGNTCPTDTVGISDSFDKTDALFATFELTNDPDFLKLRSSSGGACYPFAEAFGNVPFDNYDESGAEQCVSPESDDEMVCAYVYDSPSITCEGRKYRIQNFPSMNDAISSNAAILHQGACGVCSTAQDFGARIKNQAMLATESVKCATSFIFTRDFSALVGCYQKLGFTNSCGELWAHYVATNGSKCVLDCFGVTELTGPAPACEPSKCVICQQDFRTDFDKIAGIDFAKAGITEDIARSCGDFFPVIHDPCIALGSSAGDESSSVDSTSVETPAEGEAPETTPEMGSSAGGESSSVDSTSAETPAEGEAPETTPEMTNEDSDSSGNFIMTKFQMATSLALLMAAIFL